ncbi:CheR family methyltransferase [Bradyrhizobium sp. RDM4]|uniref:CheR family methyltransferase n=1 Tax=Bradyrhizobium sp. RDM4 TaxID=3378765 RepID=UPI0038FC8834
MAAATSSPRTSASSASFSPHSVIRDPPFSRIDLVSCRNLLIYFGADVQNQVIPTFHYALRPEGYLFLGSAENVSQFAELFAPVEKKHRIFFVGGPIRPLQYAFPLRCRACARDRVRSSWRGGSRSPALPCARRWRSRSSSISLLRMSWSITTATSSTTRHGPANIWKRRRGHRRGSC